MCGNNPPWVSALHSIFSLVAAPAAALITAAQLQQVLSRHCIFGTIISGKCIHDRKSNCMGQRLQGSCWAEGSSCWEQGRGRESTEDSAGTAAPMLRFPSLCQKQHFPTCTCVTKRCLTPLVHTLQAHFLSREALASQCDKP